MADIDQIVQIGKNAKIAESYSNSLIRTTQQAIDFGLQKIYAFYYDRKTVSINMPYVNLYDGEIVELDIANISDSPKRYLITSVSIKITNSPKKIRVDVATEGAYAPHS